MNSLDSQKLNIIAGIILVVSVFIVIGFFIYAYKGFSQFRKEKPREEMYQKEELQTIDPTTSAQFQEPIKEREPYNPPKEKGK